MKLAEILPSECFVEFSVPKAKNPQVVWKNPYDGLHSLALDEHAYFLPLNGDPCNVDSTQTKVFLGERYGGGGSMPGRGISRNGGGVRCGLTGEVQVKGIGQNPLAGTNADFSHSYGGATLHASIREAIWGEVCHLALPHGGVRIHGVIGTGTTVPRLASVDGQPATTPRGLSIREAALRPAHYMRALYYEPRSGSEKWATDVNRTRAAIMAIGLGFQAVFGGDSKDLLTAEYLNDCLTKMVRRFANQLAAARAKRIGHGALTASNIGLDGRWLDFSGATAVSDYGRIRIAPSYPDFLNEEMSLLDTLDKLPFYLFKYLPEGIGQAILPRTELIAELIGTLKSRQELEFLKLTGIPEPRLQQIDAEIKHAAYRSIRAITASGNESPIEPKPASDEPVRLKTGNFHLNSILLAAALCADRGETDTALEPHLCHQRLRAEFISSYWNLREAYYGLPWPHEDRSERIFLALNAIRVNITFGELFRPRLVAAIENLGDKEEDVTAFIDHILRKARTLLTDAQDGEIDLEDWSDQAITVSETRGFLSRGVAIPARECIASMRGVLCELGVEDKVSHAC